MFRIAICDDDKIFCEQLCDMLNKIKVLREVGVEIEKFYSGEDLLAFTHLNFREKEFDIIFLDIQFGKLMDGIAVGNMIRDKFHKKNIEIVYISSHEKYVMDLFEIGTRGFIIKPIEFNKLEKIISRIIKILTQKYSPFEYMIDKNIFYIDLYKILYFFIQGRKLEICTYNKIPNNIFYGQISKIEKQLSDSGFFRIHKSYLVNYHNVDSFQYDKIKLVNGKELWISRSYQHKVRDMHLKKIRED